MIRLAHIEFPTAKKKDSNGDFGTYIGISINSEEVNIDIDNIEVNPEIEVVDENITDNIENIVTENEGDVIGTDRKYN